MTDRVSPDRTTYAGPVGVGAVRGDEVLRFFAVVAADLRGVDFFTVDFFLVELIEPCGFSAEVERFTVADEPARLPQVGQAPMP